jgi:hypothetical protein
MIREHIEKRKDGAPQAAKKLSPAEQVKLVADNLRVFIAPGQVTELRALKVRRPKRYGRPTTESGFFDYDHLDDMAKAALDVTPHAQGVYFVLNPINPQLLYRRGNRIEVADEGEPTADRDIICRRWLLVDADPSRDSKISSTEEEKAAAWETISAVRAFLDSRGWPTAAVGDSGNGYHLLYRIDLPADDGGIVQRVLQALAQQFDTDAVKIDQSVFNPSRICKLPGTLARKGDNRSPRPHRRAKLLEVPGHE